jgi:4'-phosphopantetheinyl transferase
VSSSAAIRRSLLDGDVHVWRARLIEDERRTAEYFSLLDRQEASRAARFAYEGLRMHFVQSHGIARRILAEYAGVVDPADLVFTRSRHGKPRLVAPTTASHLHFSLSHSGDQCILAVRFGQTLGIDLERVEDLPNALDIARRNFTAAETQMLARLRGEARCDCFFAMWSRKEAIVKATGASLVTSLNRIELEPDAFGHLQLASLDGDRSRTRSWVVLGLDVGPGYAAALATPNPFRALQHFIWNEATSAAGRDAPNNTLRHRDERLMVKN